MFWPVLLLIVSLVAMIVGMVAAFSGPFQTPSRLQGAMVFLFPIGAGGAAIAAVWLVVLLARWLA